QRVQRERQLAAVEPVERDLGAQELLRDVQARHVLELVRTAVEGPDLEHESVRLGARDEMVGENAEIARAALEAGDEDQDRVGLLRGTREMMAGVAGIVQAERRPELREQ